MADKTYISIAFDQKNEEAVYIGQKKSMSGDSLIEKILDKEPRVLKIPAEVMQKNIAEAVSGFVNALDEVNAKSAGFEIDEVEFGLCIGTDGSISIASALNGGVNTQTTVKIKMKKKEKEDK